MKTARLQIIVGFFLTVSMIVTYKIITADMVDPGLRHARLAYETEKLQIEREHLKRENTFEAERIRVKLANLQRSNDLQFYGAVGLLGALVATRFMESILFQVSTRDPWAFGAVSIVVIAVALLASYLPARRASRVDPMLALRSE